MKPHLFVGIFAVLAACSDRVAAPILPQALSIGTDRRVYVGTTRAWSDGVYGIGRSETLSLLDVTVSLPPDRIAGLISDGEDNPNPQRDFVLAAQRSFDRPGAFSAAMARDFAPSTARGGRDVTIYVHGFNNSFTDAAFRMAQLAEDLDLRGPVVSYAWPSRGNPFGYEYDADSALFARDGLQSLLTHVQAAGPRHIILVAHSMGARLTMEVLRQLEMTDPGWAARNLGGVLLISPDVDIDVFRAQAAHFHQWPQPFVVFTSRNDRLLALSARARGADSRLGNIEDVSRMADLPITFLDVSNFEDGDPANHFTVATSPNLLALIRSSEVLNQGFLEGQSNASVSILGTGRVVGRAVSIFPRAGER